MLSVSCFNGFNQTAIVLRYSARMKARKTIETAKPDNITHKQIQYDVNSVVIKYCCEEVSKYGISTTKLLWVNFRMLHIRKCSIDISSSVCFAPYISGIVPLWVSLIKFSPAASEQYGMTVTRISSVSRWSLVSQEACCTSRRTTIDRLQTDSVVAWHHRPSWTRCYHSATDIG